MRQPVFEVNLPNWRDPGEVYRTHFGRELFSVWLDSGVHAESGMSYIAIGVRRVTASTIDRTVIVDGVSHAATIFEFLRAETAIVPADSAAGFRLGWVGWLGYGLGAQTIDGYSGSVAAASPSRFADAALIFVEAAIVFDHTSRSVSVIGLDEFSARKLVERLDGAGEPLLGEVATAELSTQARWAHTDDEYLRLVGECQSAIWAGDAYQLCLTTEVRVDARADELATYLRLRRSSPSHHGAFFRMGEIALLSSSPELFLSVSATGTIESMPIKGTRRRGATPTEDAALAAELVGSDKEQAENLMIVDLMRNDIARVSELGTVRVPRLLQVESYAQVHQLVSTVRGQLKNGLSGVDAVVACFPAGSMTGAPKLSAVNILERLERRERGVYSGAFGYFGLDGRIELSMVIRSILLDNAGATIGTGGGITALSVPSEELAEVKLKAAALLAALGAS